MKTALTPPSPENSAGPGSGPRRAPLTKREREILGLLSEGMSGSQIAERLVLSPETVRTHVRNAMAKLGASTRSQAVALALRHQELEGDLAAPFGAQAQHGSPAMAATPAPVRTTDPEPALDRMLGSLVALYDVDGGAIYLLAENGLALRRSAFVEAADSESEMPANVALGSGPLGRAALERRAQLVLDPALAPGRGTLIATPILGGGKLVGVVAMTTRVSRPVGRNEQLLLQAFSNRIGEILASGADVERRLGDAMDGFRASWSSTTRVA